MKKALVLFGSESDKYIYSELIENLKESFEVDFEIISAHRKPARLSERLKQDDFDFLVAGAGLAAHLPGVCASLTKKPVFGIPVEACFGGLDALLSIMQMPKDIPVGTIHASDSKRMAGLISTLSDQTSKVVHLVVDSDIQNYEYCTKEVNRFKDMALELGVEIAVSNSIVAETLNIVLFHKEEAFEIVDNALYIPLFEKSDSQSPMSALKVLDWFSNGGVWFGVNNSRNALIFLKKFIGEK
ncbi:hypothetical protein A9Q84_13490 [Halobacteriovorax marinus]|uniref:PurE domain-containing protein n=1 Tax=Halobacteriovorax marinus TaxID=97084 RepID=A0A1Y5FFE8_9BACT|nr:hypothetical protein A9Q84_13490 [Halobacteriovorax marinus]